MHRRLRDLKHAHSHIVAENPVVFHLDGQVPGRSTPMAGD